LFSTLAGEYVLDFRLGVEQALGEGVGELGHVEAQRFLEGQAFAQESDDLFTQILALFGERSVVDALDEALDDGV
jgi:hypothetical protein